MAAEYTGLLNSEIYHTATAADTTPLLMDQNAVNNSQQEHIVLPILSEAPKTGDQKTSNVALPSDGNVIITIDQPAASTSSDSQEGISTSTSQLGRSSSTSSHVQLIPVTSSSSRLRSAIQERDGSEYGPRRRSNPLNSGLWISIELAITISQIIASVIVLALSRHEKPKAPLALWIIGYAAGCVAMLPFLYWRYTHRHINQQNPDPLETSVAPSSSTPNSSQTSHTPPQRASEHGNELPDFVYPTTEWNQRLHREAAMDAWISVQMERFKIALDCFFAVWFVVGNVWIFGGRSSSHEAPNLYRLCIVFLTFSCINYAMPFIVCATVCCCLPCIITLLSYREDNAQVRGAAPEVIAALPIYKFKTKEVAGTVFKDGQDSDSESIGEGGTFAPGTEKERVVSGEDAVCCICLGAYKDDVDLKELSCSHFFHVECVDKWLKINASCPLCKHELRSSGDDHHE